MDPHQQQPTSLIAMAKSLWRHRALIRQMTTREILGRYRGSFMGLAWSFFNPLIMLLVYTFVFTTVFHSRWTSVNTSNTANFAIMLFIGMIVYAIFADCVNRAPTLITSNASYVKRVVFPLEILPIINMGASLFHALVSILAWLIAYVLLMGVPHFTALLLPLIILPFVIGTVGVSWFLSSLGVFLRDINQTVGIITTALMFLAPVFYSLHDLPSKYKPLVMANPVTFVIEQSRTVLVWGGSPDWLGLAVYSLASLLVAWAGFYWFQRTRKGFADVL
ncbi:MAG: ABC transporter permease [Rhodanobacter sp.]|nr:MAG: ABC transporter permease [Rhodanobacter sp.]